MEILILEKLKSIEKEYDIEILFAVESGSRAWGFPSEDSDYDIRFVYKHKASWYLNLWEQKDTIQFMTHENFDGVGWDLKKALKLLSKSNASFLEWLFSPIIYKVTPLFLEEMKSLATEFFNPISTYYHYHSMNKRYLENVNNGCFTIKQFFYALRTALCVKWVRLHNTIPPVFFNELFVLIPENLHGSLKDLILAKAKTNEKDSLKVALELVDFLKETVSKNTTTNLKKAKSIDVNRFNHFFLKNV